MDRFASLKKRILALLLDFLTFICYGLILFAVTGFVFMVILDGIPNFSELGMNVVSLTMVLPVVLYSIMMESGRRHATLGKRKMKIKVASAAAQPVRARRIVIRNIVKFLPWQLAHMAIFRGFAFNWALPPFWVAMLVITDMLPLVWIAFLFRKDQRGIHGLIAGTVVLDVSRR